MAVTTSVQRDPDDLSTGTTLDGSSEANVEASGPTLGRALGLLIMALGFFVGARVIHDNSFLTHFTTGDLIRSTGSVPTVDPYSATAAGEPWTVQSWLASYFYSFVNDVVGGFGLRLLNGALTACLVFHLWKLSRSVSSVMAQFGLVGSMVLIGASTWTPRPLLFGLLGFVIVARVLAGQIRAPWLVPVMWLWVNTHGSFPLGIALIGATMVGAALDERRLPERDLRVLGWALAGTALGVVNPLGIRLLIFPVELLSRREALQDVAEWAPPGFDRVYQWLFLALVIGGLWAINRTRSFRLALPAVCFAAGGFLAVRNISVAAIVLVGLIAASLSGPTRLMDGTERGFSARAIGAVGAAGLAVAMLAVFVTAPLDLSRYPVEEVTWLEDEGLIGAPDSGLVHRDTVGNYLHFRLGLDANVFVDDRFDFYPDTVLRDHRALIFGGDFAEILDRNGAQTVLWERETDLAEWLDEEPTWVIAHETDDWIIARRAD